MFHASYSPGRSPSSVDFNGGDVTFDESSVLNLEIGGTTPGTQYDQLLGIGKLTFNGKLNVVFGIDFVPHAGDRFTLLGYRSFEGSLAMQNITFSRSDGSPLGFDLTQLQFSQRADGFAIAAVPEPGSYAMMLAGMWLLRFVVGYRRRAQ